MDFQTKNYRQIILATITFPSSAISIVNQSLAVTKDANVFFSIDVA